MYLSFSALLGAFVDIIPRKFRGDNLFSRIWKTFLCQALTNDFLRKVAKFWFRLVRVRIQEGKRSEKQIMRTIIIGDIHGCHQELLALLGKVQFDREQDRLVSLGDLMDRGDQSFEVFETFRLLKAEMGERCVIIRGNHEQMMLDASVNPMARILWKQNGGGKTLKSFYKHQDHVYHHAGWFRGNTVLYYEEDGFQCTHAGLEDGDISQSDPETLLWDRTRLTDNDYSGKLTVVGHTPLSGAAWCAGDGKNRALLTERTRTELPGQGMICLDTGCVFGYRLTAMVVEDGSFWLDSVGKSES